MDSETIEVLSASLLEEILRKNTSVWAGVYGKSMCPAFGAGSKARVARCGAQDIHIGDIAVYKNENTVVCHRFYGKEIIKGRLFLKTKGDTVSSFDLLVSPEQLIGKVVAFKVRDFLMPVNNIPCRFAGFMIGFILPLIVKLHSLFKKPAPWTIP